LHREEVAHLLEALPPALLVTCRRGGRYALASCQQHRLRSACGGIGVSRAFSLPAACRRLVSGEPHTAFIAIHSGRERLLHTLRTRSTLDLSRQVLEALR